MVSLWRRQIRIQLGSVFISGNHSGIIGWKKGKVGKGDCTGLSPESIQKGTEDLQRRTKVSYFSSTVYVFIYLFIYSYGCAGS